MALRLQRAINAHDLDGIASCFDPEYDSIQPLHPERAFRGSEQLRRNWAQILGGLPDLRADLLRWAVNGDELWTEWEWSGTRPDGTPGVMRGVTVQGLRDDLVAWVRFYMEPIEEHGAGIDETIAQQFQERRMA